MKKFYAACLSALFFSSCAYADEVKIDISNYAFTPATVTVAPGTKVTWVNRDQIPHGVADKDKLFRSPAMDTNETYSFTYTIAGSHPYFCTLHPYMTGTVVVTK